MKRRLIIIVSLSCFLLSTLTLILPPQILHADPTTSYPINTQSADIQLATFTFQDRANIIGDFGASGQVNFVDKDPNDKIANYAPPSGSGFCNPLSGSSVSGSMFGITLGKKTNFSAASIPGGLIVGYSTTVGVNTKCHAVGRAVSISNPDSAAIYGLQWDGDNITTVSGVANGGTFVPAVNFNGPLYISKVSNKCGANGAILLNSGSTNSGTFYDLSDSTGHKISEYPEISKAFGSKCKVRGKVPVAIKGTQGTSAPNGGGSNSSGGGGGGGGGAGVQCNLGIKPSALGILNALNPLNWLLCGIIQGLNGVVQGLDDQINNMLDINTNQIFGNGGYEQAWSKFENIALGLLVIIGLIIVISQALGMEVLDAYTIRKMLPRVLIATVAITLSWQLMKFTVTVSNDLGWGVQRLIESSFPGSGTVFHTGGANNILVAFASAVGIAVLGLFGLMSFAGTAAIAVIITFLVLILRQIAVIMLMVFAPIAIVAYILPNTQRLYKFWWESFSKMLLMFPMIVGFIAIAHVFSGIATKQSDDITHQVIAFIAYFGPYFAIPLTFRFAGSIMGTVGNAVNSGGEGARGFLRNFRSGQRKQHTAELKAGTRFEGKRWIPGSIKAANKFGEVSKGAGTGWKGRYGFRERGRLARRQVDQAARDEALQTPGMKAIKGKNDYNRILAEGMGDERRGRAKLMEHLMTGGDDGRTFMRENEARAQADVAAKAAKVAGGFTKASGIAAFYNMANDGTAIRNEHDLARLAAVAGQGDNNNTLSFAAEGAVLSKRAGRPDLAPATEQIVDHAFRESDKLFNNGGSKLYTGSKTDHQLEHAAKISAYGNTQGYERFTGARGRALRNEHSYLAEVISDKTGKYSPKEKQEAATAMQDAKAAIASGMGAVNKRKEAVKALQPANEAYEAYMKTQTGGTKVEEVARKEYVKTDEVTTRENVVKEQVPRAEVNQDVVVDIAGGGGRQRGLSEAERAEEASKRNQPEEPEQK